MSLNDEGARGGFAFFWSIHNFSHCVQKESEFLESPSFGAEENTTWFLRLFPKGNGAPGFASCYIRRDKGVSSTKFMLSFRGRDGLFFNSGENTVESYDLEPVGEQCFLKFNQFNELSGPDAPCLDKDTLHLCCRIWRNSNDLLQLVKCHVDTRIKVTKIDFKMILNNILDCTPNNTVLQRQTKHIPWCSSMYFKLSLAYGGVFGDDTIHLRIQKYEETEKLLLVCTIHLLDVGGNVAHSVRDKYLFEWSCEKHIWAVPILSMRKILSMKKLYLLGGKLTLQCEFRVSTGAVSSETKLYEMYGFGEFPSPAQKQIRGIPEVLKETKLRWYNGGKLSDVTVHTASRMFPVHKSNLCAQSEVFTAMFERDLQENLTGVVEIEDLEDDTVSKMLVFLYTDTLEDLDFSTACKLYFAADKYRITALQMKCTNHLKLGLDTSNVCDVLVLADTHQDQELKSFAKDFILVNAHEVVKSEEWQKLMESSNHLTSEIMQWLICQVVPFRP